MTQTNQAVPRPIATGRKSTLGDLDALEVKTAAYRKTSEDIGADSSGTNSGDLDGGETCIVAQDQIATAQPASSVVT